MSETQAAWRHGSCHYGAVEFEVRDDLSRTASGNCSICRRAGWVLVFAKADNFRLLKGEGAQTDYQFGKKNAHHRFCSTCGVRAFGEGKGKDGTVTYVVNVRCLDGVDAHTLTIKNQYDGKSL